jgi:deoxyribodipyrimidine photo-lyase
MKRELSRKKTIVNIVWFKKDLRSSDHAPLNEATLGEYPVLPIYVFEPDYWEQEDAAFRHWEFTKQSLEFLRTDLSLLGQALVFRRGKVLDVFEDLKKEFKINAIYSHQETGNAWTFQRDNSVRCWGRANGIKILEYQNNSIVRGLVDRDNWAAQRDKFMSKGILEKPNIRPLEIDLSHISVDINFRGNSVKNSQQIGGAENGWKYLESFFQGRSNNYKQDMSSPLLAETSCSRISPYLAYGNLSVREVLWFVKNNSFKDKKMSSSVKSFKSRLAWKDHFGQKLEDDFLIESACLHRSYENLRPKIPDITLLTAWENGETGFPFVDACMRYLRKTGWINFRMRAMLMSFASYHLWLDWRNTGKILANFFTDYDPGIHWPQVQMQSGTTGINAIRIYNPIKQGIDQDPDGVFIRKWVPELCHLTTAELHKVGTGAMRLNLGSSYPQAVVELDRAGKYAREKVWEVRKLHGFKNQAQTIVKKHGSRQNKSRDFVNDRIKTKNKLQANRQMSFVF